LASAVALVERGCRVELFEARRRLGGRAGSYVDQATGELIDHCQHVAMGCCTNYLDFCRRTGIDELFTRHEELFFLGPDGRCNEFRPVRWLPAPLHLVGPLWRLSYLSVADKLGICQAMLRLMRRPACGSENDLTVLEWLGQERQSPAAIERFWQVVLVSALGESLERASLSMARKVFIDGFLAHPAASHVLVPKVSLTELYDKRASAWLTGQGAVLHLESPVAQILGDGSSVCGVSLSGGSSRHFDFVIVAVPWQHIAEIFPATLKAIIDPHDRFSCLNAAPISAAHLWFDRPLTTLPHAVLVGRLAQWVFTRPLAGQADQHYYQIVISASRDLAGRPRQAIIDEIASDLAAVFPATRTARLLNWKWITDQDAVFSTQPGVDAIRPPQQTAIRNLMLAGDWTRTGWPATMEGAVRSGYLAAEAVLSQTGRPERILIPDLPRSWLPRILITGDHSTSQ
jgi:squalene-associated FAD-dependent desaturase